MYSPRIKDDLIPILYILGKEQGKAMTQIVDDILREYLTQTKMIGKTTYAVKQETFIIKNGGNENV